MAVPGEHAASHFTGEAERQIPERQARVLPQGGEEVIGNALAAPRTKRVCGSKEAPGQE